MSLSAEQLAELSKQLGGVEVKPYTPAPATPTAPAVAPPAPSAPQSTQPVVSAPVPASGYNEWDPTTWGNAPAAPTAPAAKAPLDPTGSGWQVDAAGNEFIQLPTAEEIAADNTPDKLAEKDAKRREWELTQEIKTKGFSQALADAMYVKDAERAAEIERIATAMEQKKQADLAAGIKVDEPRGWNTPGVVEQGFTIGGNLVKGAGGLVKNFAGGGMDILKEAADVVGIRDFTEEDRIQATKRAAEGGRAIDSALEGAQQLIKMPARGLTDLTMNLTDVPEWEQNIELAKDRAKDLVTSRQVAEGQRGFIGKNATAANIADAAANPERTDILADQEAINNQALAGSLLLPARAMGDIMKAGGKAVDMIQGTATAEKVAQGLSTTKRVLTGGQKVDPAIAKATAEATKNAPRVVKQMAQRADKLDAAAADIQKKIAARGDKLKATQKAEMAGKAADLTEDASVARAIARDIDPNIGRLRGTIGKRLATMGQGGGRYASGVLPYAARRLGWMGGRAALGGMLGGEAAGGHGGGILGGIILGGLAGKATNMLTSGAAGIAREVGERILTKPTTMLGKAAAGTVDAVSNVAGRGAQGAIPGAAIAAGISAGDWERMTGEEKNQVLGFGAVAGAVGNQLNRAPKRGPIDIPGPRPGFEFQQPDLPALPPRQGGRVGPMPEQPGAASVPAGESPFASNPPASPLGTDGLPALLPRQGPRQGPMPEAPREGGLAPGESGFESNPAMSPLGPDGLPAMAPRQGARTGPTPEAPRGNSLPDGETGFESNPPASPLGTDGLPAAPARQGQRTGPGPEDVGYRSVADGETGMEANPRTQDGSTQDVGTGETTPTGEVPSSGVRAGTLIPEQPIAELTLSKDVPQFKRGADKTTGVVKGQQLQGKPDRVGMAPIVVWERLNGRKEVISGRHRLDLFKRAGEETIPSTVIKEADGFNAQDAITLDAELNIRDGQGSVNDYADYHRAKGYTETEAIERGLLRGTDLQGSKARQGFEISKAGDDLYASFQAGNISARKAAVIAKNAGGDAQLERAGMRAGRGLPVDALEIHMGNLKRLTPTDTAIQGDFFANDSLIQSYEKLAKVAGDRVADMQKNLNLLRSVGNVRKMTAAQRKAAGVSVNDPDAIPKRIAELEADIARYKNFGEDPELFAEIAGEAGVDMKVVQKQKPEPKPTDEAPPKEDLPPDGGGDMFAEPTPPTKPVAPADVVPDDTRPPGFTPPVDPNRAQLNPADYAGVARKKALKPEPEVWTWTPPEKPAAPRAAMNPETAAPEAPPTPTVVPRKPVQFAEPGTTTPLKTRAWPKREFGIDVADVRRLRDALTESGYTAEQAKAISQELNKDQYARYLDDFAYRGEIRIEDRPPEGTKPEPKAPKAPKAEKKPKAKKEVQPDKNLIPEDDMPFNLVGEEDTTPLLQKQADEAAAAAKAKADADAAQGDLFAEKKPATKKPATKKRQAMKPEKEPEAPKVVDSGLTPAMARSLLEADKTPKGKLDNMFDKDSSVVSLRNRAYKAMGGTKSQPTGTDLANLIKEKYGSIDEARKALQTLSTTTLDPQ
jgi:hypothetical protein